MDIKPLQLLYIIALSLVLGVMFGSIISKETLESHARMDPRDIPAMMQTCEAKLPRNINCQLVAIPKVTNENVAP